METFWLNVLDWFFFVFHLALVLFNLLGWIWKKTRLWNLIVLFLTLFSWFGLGVFYGFGFCPITEWHWQVLGKLGQTGLPNSYISYLIYRITTIVPPQLLVDYATMIGAFLAFIISSYLNVRDWVARKKQAAIETFNHCK
ncbi:MAG TPA: DUF2784 family protein [Bacteroidales bacterium]|nr:DUF2784 family protein [Bacteroidales bacterium]